MLKVQAFFHKIFEKFNNDLYLWKSEVATIKKGKIFNISLNIAHFSFFFFLTEPHIYLYNTLCKSHGFFMSCFESGNISKNVTFWKISFCHSFLDGAPISLCHFFCTSVCLYSLLSRIISQEPYIIWSWFVVHMCKRIISPGVFYIFPKF